MFRTTPSAPCGAPRRVTGADRGLGGQVLTGGRGAVDGLIRGFCPAEGAHHGGRPEERLTANVPAVALDFFDEHPGHLAEGLRSLEGDHHVGEPGGQVVLLFLGKGSRGELDDDQRHDVLLCGRVTPVSGVWADCPCQNDPPGLGAFASARSLAGTPAYGAPPGGGVRGGSRFYDGGGAAEKGCRVMLRGRERYMPSRRRGRRHGRNRR